MPTSFPGSLDNFTNPTATDAPTSPDHAAQHANANDAIEAIETAIGVKYGARVHANRTTVQTITTGTNTAITLNDAESYDTDNFHSTVTNLSRITIPASMGGIYQLTAATQWAVSATGNRITFLQVNGVTPLVGSTVAGVAGNSLQQNVTAVVSLAAGDYVELIVFQSSGGNLTTTNSSVVAVKIA